MKPIAELACLVVDCGEPAPVAHFYAAVGGGTVRDLDATGAYVSFGATLLAIRKVENYQPPTWPDNATPMQMHMDFNVDDLDQAETLLQSHGATVPEYQPHREQGLVVLLDPAGHPFCIGTRV